MVVFLGAQVQLHPERLHPERLHLKQLHLEHQQEVHRLNIYPVKWLLEIVFLSLRLKLLRVLLRVHPQNFITRCRNIKKEIKDDAEALQAARIISNFPNDMDKFLKMVINNYELLNYGGVNLALREQISINQDPAVGRLSKNGIIFISYISGRLVYLLKELSTLPESDDGKKRSLLYKIKQIEKVICLLDDVGCSWGVRPYNEAEMDAIAEYYKTTIKNPKGLTEYHQQLNTFIDIYFPVLKNILTLHM